MLQPGLKCRDRSPKGSRRHCRRQEGSLLQPPGVSPGFSSGSSRGRAQSCCMNTFSSSTAKGSSSHHPHRGDFGVTQEQGEVSGAAARAGHDHKTSCNVQEAAWKGKKNNSLVSLRREGVGSG